LDWPASFYTWDILFLLPVPWTGPVLAPVLVSAVMIGAGLWHLRAEARRAPVHIRPAGWAGILAGALVIIVAFAMDYRNIMAGGQPNPFNWAVFAAGLLLGTGSYAWSANAAQSRRV